MRSLLIVAALALCATAASPQQSLFQSGNGQTSLYLTSPTAAINFGDSKASFGFFYKPIQCDRFGGRNMSVCPWFFGAEGYATANSGAVALFNSDKPKAPEGGGDFSVGKHYLAAKPKPPGEANIPYKEDWLLLDLGYSRSSFYLYPTSTTPSTSTPKTNFDRFRAIVAYNYFYGGSMVGGIAVGAERRNNLTDLKSVSLQTTVVAAPTGGQTSIVQTQAGFYGNYKEYVAVPIYEDFLVYPGKAAIPGTKNRIAFDLFSRADIAAPHREANGGIGLYIMKEGQEETPLGGISASYDGSKFQVGVTVGFSFSK
jgi:hypothetical protein